MRKLGELFFIKDLSGRYYCYTTIFVFKRLRFLFFVKWYIKRLGYDVTIFDDKKKAVAFLSERKAEYVKAIKYIQ
jgi:hypothetical protein